MYLLPYPDSPASQSSVETDNIVYSGRQQTGWFSRRTGHPPGRLTTYVYLIWCVSFRARWQIRQGAGHTYLPVSGSLITIGTAYGKARPALYYSRPRPRQPQRVEDRSFGREAGGRRHACSLTCRRSKFELDAKRPKESREAGGRQVVCLQHVRYLSMYYTAYLGFANRKLFQTRPDFNNLIALHGILIIWIAYLTLSLIA